RGGELGRPGTGARRAAGDRAGGGVPAASPRGRAPGAAEALLATWHNLLDAGRMQDGEPNLAGTARRAIAKMSVATAAEAGVADGEMVCVATIRGSIVLPVAIPQMPDRVVWLPTNTAGCAVRRDLGAGHGSLVAVSSPEDDPRSHAVRSAE